MNHNYIDFKRQRGLGEVISDTFAFIRQQYKALLKIIFQITGPVFIVLLASLAFYSYTGLDFIGGDLLDFSKALSSGLYLISAFILFASVVIYYALLNSTVLHFIKSYVGNNGIPDTSEIRAGVKKDFSNMLGLILISAIMIVIGLFFCVLPGIFLWVPLSLSPAVLIFRRESITDAIGTGFSLIKDNWWITFFTLLLMSILVYIVSLVFQFPMLIYYFIKAFTIVQEGSAADPSALFDWVYVVFNVISSLFQYLLSSIIIIAVALIYFNLDEKKNFTGSFEKISRLGRDHNS